MRPVKTAVWIIAAFWLATSQSLHARPLTEVIDFERSTSGAGAANLYSDRGVTFSGNPSILETASAHSGSRVLWNVAPGSEFAPHHLDILFEQGIDVRRVGLYLGLDPRATSFASVSVTLTAYVLRRPVPPRVGLPGPPYEAAVDSVTVTLTGPGKVKTPIPLTTYAQVSSTTSEAIVRVRVSYDPPYQGILIDDLDFDPFKPYPLTLVKRPVVQFLHPLRGDLFEGVTPYGDSTRQAPVDFLLEIDASAELSLVQASVTAPDGSHSEYLVCGGYRAECPSMAPSFDSVLDWTASFGMAGEYVVTAAAYDTRGNVGSAATSFSIELKTLHDLQILLGGSPVTTNPEVDFLVRVELPENQTLEDVRLTMDDVSNLDNWSAGTDTTVTLVGADARFDDIVLENVTPAGVTHYTYYHIRFLLPMWQLGWNRVRVTVGTIDQRGRLHHYNAETGFFFRSEANWGIGGMGASGRLGTSFELPGIPIWATDCPFVFCKDADQDGLLDLWENVAVEMLRPELRFHEDEELFDNDSHHVRTFARLNPVYESDVAHAVGERPRKVLLRGSVAFSEDYGYVVAGHHGDTQKFQLLWSIVGERIDLEWARGEGHFSKAIPHPPFSIPDPRDWQRAAGSLTFSPSGVLRLFVEENKHGLWPSKRRCDTNSFYDCSDIDEFALRPPAANVGEPYQIDELAGGLGFGRPSINRLDDVPARGPHPDFYNVFPHETVWTPNWVFENGPHFCGGLGWDGSCAGHLSKQLKRSESAFPRWPDDDLSLVTPGRR